jgi:hypothetical protein
MQGIMNKIYYWSNQIVVFKNLLKRLLKTVYFLYGDFIKGWKNFNMNKNFYITIVNCIKYISKLVIVKVYLYYGLRSCRLFFLWWHNIIIKWWDE